MLQTKEKDGMRHQQRQMESLMCHSDLLVSHARCHCM